MFVYVERYLFLNTDSNGNCVRGGHGNLWFAGLGDYLVPQIASGRGCTWRPRHRHLRKLMWCHWLQHTSCAIVHQHNTTRARFSFTKPLENHNRKTVKPRPCDATRKSVFLKLPSCVWVFTIWMVLISK